MVVIGTTLVVATAVAVFVVGTGVGASVTVAVVCWVVWGPGVAVVPVQPHIAIKTHSAMIRIAQLTGNLASLNKITSFLLIKEFKNVYLRIYDL